MTPPLKPPAHTWSTLNECAWLDALGTHTNGVVSLGRHALFQRYLTAPRWDWGQMRREICLAHARALLEAQEDAG